MDAAAVEHRTGSDAIVADRREPGGATRSTIRVYAAIAATLTAVACLAPRWFMNPHAPARAPMHNGWLLSGWVRWDSWWYVEIARFGYTYRPHHMSSVAFFPVYPLLARLVTAVAPVDAALAAYLVTLASGAGTLVLFRRWCAARLTPRATRGAVLVLALYPFAWFLYGAAYSDALYLFLVLSAFLLLEDDRPLAAGIVGAIATATRPTGITLVIGLAALVLQRRRGKVRTRDLGVAVSVTGLVAWCAWLAIRFGNPFAFVETEGAPGWNQPPGPHTWFKVRFFQLLGRAPLTVTVPLVLQAVACIAFAVLSVAVARRFGTGYGVYVLAVAVIPAVSTSDFLGVGRYLLPAFPVFALAGAWLAERPVARALTTLSCGAGLVIGTAMYASGYLIS